MLTFPSSLASDSHAGSVYVVERLRQRHHGTTGDKRNVGAYSQRLLNLKELNGLEFNPCTRESVFQIILHHTRSRLNKTGCRRTMRRTGIAGVPPRAASVREGPCGFRICGILAHL